MKNDCQQFDDAIPIMHGGPCSQCIQFVNAQFVNADDGDTHSHFRSPLRGSNGASWLWIESVEKTLIARTEMSFGVKLSAKKQGDFRNA